jgi:hypothetical protein
MSKHWGLFFVAVLALCSCGKKNSTTLGITFDSSVPDDQKNLLQGDLALVEGLNFLNVSYEDLSRIGLNDMSAPALASFISQRTKMIVGESFDYSSQANIVAANYPYNPVLLADSRLADSNVVTVMSNIGASLFLAGQQSNYLLSVNVCGESVTVNSPRVGILKIGAGLFNNSKTQNLPIDSLGSRLVRLGTLFHESRHSDGNGSNAAFPHAQCPSGDFAGYYACEANLNGPYNLQAMMLTHFYQVCAQQGCSQNELSALQLAAADAASRLLPGAVQSDPTPEAIR